MDLVRVLIVDGGGWFGSWGVLMMKAVLVKRWRGRRQGSRKNGGKLYGGEGDGV